MPYTAEIYPDDSSATLVLDGLASVVGKHRASIWVSGTVAVEPTTPGQGQPFAVWHQSDLRYSFGLDHEPPADYTGLDYKCATEPPSYHGE